MILLLNPLSGISGDMLLGALLDLGAPLDVIEEAIRETEVEGWSIRPERVSKDGIGATYANVEVHGQATPRHAWELFDAVSRVSVAEVANLAQRAIHAIAVVEAGIHGTTPDDVHLHEVGGVDTVVDIVGAAAALHALGIDRVYSQPVAVGTGDVRTAHGLLPVPAPATAALLRGARIRGSAVRGETVTPTGAAMLTAMRAAYEPVESCDIVEVGYGAGTKDFPGQPNVLQAILCAPTATPDDGATQKSLLETNLDDISGEHLGYLISKALELGALDAWADQVLGKKGRPAFVLHVLCDADRSASLQAFLFEESGTLGIRVSHVQRAELPRWTTSVEVAGREIPVKMSPHGGKPERDAVVRGASTSGLTVREFAARAAAAVQALPSDPPPSMSKTVAPLWMPGAPDETLRRPAAADGHHHNEHPHSH